MPEASQSFKCPHEGLDSVRDVHRASEIPMIDACAHAASSILMFAVLPLWILAGLADVFCHGFSRIEETSGWRESVLHLLQLTVIGLPVALTLFLEVNASLFAIWILCLVIHHGVAY